MKLGLQATNIFFEGPKHAGVSRSSLQLLEAILRRTEHEYLVFVRPEANYPKAWDSLPHVKVIKITHRTRLWKWFLGDLEPYLHGCRNWFSVSGQVSRLPGIKKASLIHDIFFHTYRDTYTEEDYIIHRDMYQNIARHTSFVFSNSQSTADQFSKHFGYPLKRVHPLPFGIGQAVNHEALGPLSDEELAALGLPPRFLLSVSTVEPRKNFPRLIEAFRKVANHDSLIDVPLVLVGASGWKSQPIFEEIAASDIAKRIIFLGYVDDETLIRLYKTAMFAVTPSLEEGFGMPLLEAMTYGCLCCSSSTGALLEVGGDVPIYFDPLDAESIGEALIKTATLQDANQRRQSGIERSEQFSWDLSATVVLNTFQASS